MSVNILTIQELGRENWDSFVRNHPHGSIYHTSAWHKAIEDSYSFRTSYLVIRDAAGAIRSGLPLVSLRNLFLGRRSVCYPFSDYCDPLVKERNDLTVLLNCLAESAEPFEIRAHQLNHPVEGTRSDDSFFSYQISLSGNSDELYSRLHRSCIQRKIKKSEKSGVKVREGHTPSDLKEFYRLHLLTRKRLGLPSQPFLFFRNLWENFGASGEMEILFAEYKSRAIGALLLIGYRKPGGPFTGGDILYYKYGASDSRYFSLGFNPALFWQAILLAKSRGYSALDLGRASGTDEAGLGAFKEHLGAEKRPLTYYTTAGAYSETGKSRGAHLAGRIVKITPGWVSGIAGRLFYRYLG